MALTVTATRADLAGSDATLLAVLLNAGSALPAAASSLDELLGGALRRTLERRDFRGSRDETLHLAGGTSGPQRLLLVGMGRAGDDATAVVSALRRAAGL